MGGGIFVRGRRTKKLYKTQQKLVSSVFLTFVPGERKFPGGGSNRVTFAPGYGPHWTHDEAYMKPFGPIIWSSKS